MPQFANPYIPLNMKMIGLEGLSQISNMRGIPKEDKRANVYSMIVTVENLYFPISVPKGMLNKNTGKKIEKQSRLNSIELYQQGFYLRGISIACGSMMFHPQPIAKSPINKATQIFYPLIIIQQLSLYKETNNLIKRPTQQTINYQAIPNKIQQLQYKIISQLQQKHGLFVICEFDNKKQHQIQTNTLLIPFCCMKSLRRKTYHSTVTISENPSVIKKKRTVTISGGDRLMSQSSDNILDNNQVMCKRQYAKLTIKSLQRQYPLSELRPFSLNNSIQQIYEDMNDAAPIFRTTSQSQKTNFQQFFKARAKKSIKVFRQSRQGRRSTKSRFIKTAPYANAQKNDEDILACQYLKDVKQFQQNQRNKFERINERIKDEFPHQFQPIIQHQQSKCRSKSCNQGFFKRKKFRVEQKYEIEQPGYQKIKWQKKNITPKNDFIDNDRSFYMYFKSKNKALNTQQKDRQSIIESIKQAVNKSRTKSKKNTRVKENLISNSPSKKGSQNLSSIKDEMELNELSVSFYKKYMKGSHLQRKVTLSKDFKIKPL